MDREKLSLVRDKLQQEMIEQPEKDQALVTVKCMLWVLDALLEPDERPDPETERRQAEYDAKARS